MHCKTKQLTKRNNSKSYHKLSRRVILGLSAVDCKSMVRLAQSQLLPLPPYQPAISMSMVSHGILSPCSEIFQIMLLEVQRNAETDIQSPLPVHQNGKHRDLRRGRPNARLSVNHVLNPLGRGHGPMVSSHSMIKTSGTLLRVPKFVLRVPKP